MPEKPKHNWLAIRTAYVVKGYTAEHCATEFGVHVVTVRRRASKEGWTAERSANATSGEKVAQDEARKVVASAAQSHRAMLAKLDKLVDDSITDIEAITDLGEKILARQRTITMATRIVVTGRIVAGELPGQPSGTGDLDAPAAPDGSTSVPTGDMDGDNAPAPMRRFVVKIHQPALTVVPDQATG